ncbi:MULTISPECIES: MogA/MoaB family molybdenum cofactor biosynthesis protein [Gordonia]|uniref:MogA/MoaB family molybdenum cofactor biosynthesis protein n=1 Tax=Gordonia TaxID=2053 RepID=UPI000961D863|nr:MULTISPECIES: molybdenum cofactor synthesis domain-containing protein [Gordonia]MDH3009433.1 molybdopterin-binding protein [Gordonia alkanivorans]MDH3027098.1 molybdopterin-binding protein [Gordonia alkanivorans]MDH3050941.1 molybdopterin-binding protein [Gordonia alkanivorans]OLT49549.1 molybdenum cofactor biosynthesis protein [Gordonia sp. CNJ-863]QGP87372.1 molybdenum cofactor biosynthesis protein [Gordonia sp. 135]
MSDAGSPVPGNTAISGDTVEEGQSLDVRLAGDPGQVDPADVVAADAAAREFVARHEQAAHRPPGEEIGRALVVVVDDEAAHGEDQRLLGPLVSELLAEAGFHVDAAVVVPGDEVEIRNALNTAVIGGVDLVVSVGGVGVGARDVTPEATEPLLDRRLRGIEEAIRSSGLAAGATDGGLSRGLAGISGQTLVVNIADSRAAVRDGMATAAPLAKYVIESISEF